jgi:hypothetical protein
MSQWMIEAGLGPIGFLLIANLLLLVAGNFMEPASIILIFAPILFPIAMTLGIDPVHFGIVMTVNMEIGMITSPCWTQPVCGQWHIQAGAHRYEQSSRTMVAHHAGVFDDRHLLGTVVSLAAQNPWNDVAD